MNTETSGAKIQINFLLEQIEEKAYYKGFNDREEEGCGSCHVADTKYLQGLADAWNAARRVVSDIGITYGEFKKIFGAYTHEAVLKKFSASEVIQILKEHDATKEHWSVADEDRCAENIQNIVDAGFTLEEIERTVKRMKEDQ